MLSAAGDGRNFHRVQYFFQPGRGCPRMIFPRRRPLRAPTLIWGDGGALKQKRFHAHSETKACVENVQYLFHPRYPQQSTRLKANTNHARRTLWREAAATTTILDNTLGQEDVLRDVIIEICEAITFAGRPHETKRGDDEQTHPRHVGHRPLAVLGPRR